MQIPRYLLDHIQDLGLAAVMLQLIEYNPEYRGCMGCIAGDAHDLSAGPLQFPDLKGKRKSWVHLRFPQEVLCSVRYAIGL